MMLPETQAKTANVMTIIADEPAAKPSIPSVKFAPLETPVTIKTNYKNENDPSICLISITQKTQCF